MGFLTSKYKESKHNMTNINTKNTPLFLILLTLLIVTLSGCGNSPETTNETNITSDETTTSEEETIDYSKHSNLIKIEGSKDLYYYSDTKIVYIAFDAHTYSFYIGDLAGHGYGFMSPYYSDNGKLCKYIDGDIVEVEWE